MLTRLWPCYYITQHTIFEEGWYGSQSVTLWCFGCGRVVFLTAITLYDSCAFWQNLLEHCSPNYWILLHLKQSILTQWHLCTIFFLVLGFGKMFEGVQKLVAKEALNAFIWHLHLNWSLTNCEWYDAEPASSFFKVIMSAMASQITGVCSAVCSGADQRKHQSSASLAFVTGIHGWPVHSLHKGPVTRKMFSFDDVIMTSSRA